MNTAATRLTPLPRQSQLHRHQRGAQNNSCHEGAGRTPAPGLAARRRPAASVGIAQRLGRSFAADGPCSAWGNAKTPRLQSLRFPKWPPRAPTNPREASRRGEQAAAGPHCRREILRHKRATIFGSAPDYRSVTLSRTQRNCRLAKATPKISGAGSWALPRVFWAEGPLDRFRCLGVA